MKKRTKTAVAVGVGVAAAATAGIVIARRASGAAAYVVASADDGWSVRADGASSPISTHATKRDAVESARALARANAPSELVIHRTDGTVQARHSYAVE
jgi:hypothetical protein